MSEVGVVRPKYLADMNLSPLTVAALQAEQYDIERVSSLLPATAADSVILELARDRELVVITQDLDFSSLLALGGYTEPSLVTLRLTNTDSPIHHSPFSVDPQHIPHLRPLGRAGRQLDRQWMRPKRQGPAVPRDGETRSFRPASSILSIFKLTLNLLDQKR